MKLPLPILALTTAAAFSQGRLAPSAAPAPTMKSLQEIWDKIGGLETQNTTLQSQVAALQTQNSQFTTLVNLVSTATVDFAWVVTTVDASGFVGYDTSLVFGPDGQPAISYFESSSEDLKFARMGVFTPAP